MDAQSQAVKASRRGFLTTGAAAAALGAVQSATGTTAGAETKSLKDLVAYGDRSHYVKILDTSALLSILRCDAEAKSFATAIAGAERRRLAAANYLEAAIEIDGSRHPIASRRFDDLLREAQIVIEPVTELQAKVAREAYRDFGQGSGHPAKLNLGDCFAYALAKTSGEPLLFQGDGFAYTGIATAER